MASFLAHLFSLLEEVSRPLPKVSRKKMFGCETLFVDGSIYALVWKTGRIGLKLPDPAAFDELAALPGAEPWSPGGKMKMGSWLLVPESFHDDEDTLAAWTKRAHALVRAGALAKGAAGQGKGATRPTTQTKPKTAPPKNASAPKAPSKKTPSTKTPRKTSSKTSPAKRVTRAR